MGSELPSAPQKKIKIRGRLNGSFYVYDRMPLHLQRTHTSRPSCLSDLKRPIQAFTRPANAAAQLPEIGHSCILQHSSADEGREADKSAFRGNR